MCRFINSKPTSLYGTVCFCITIPSTVPYHVNLPGLLFSAFAPHLVNTFTRRVRVRLGVSVRIMVNCKNRVRFRGYMSVNSPKLFFPVRVKVRVSNVVSSVYKQR